MRSRQSSFLLDGYSAKDAGLPVKQLLRLAWFDTKAIHQNTEELAESA